MRYLVAIQHRLHGKFHTAFIAGVIVNGYLAQMYRGIATVDIFLIVLDLFDFNEGQRRYVKYTRASLSFSDVV